MPSTIRHNPVRPTRFGARAVPAVVFVAIMTATAGGTRAQADIETQLPDLAATPATNSFTEVYSDASGNRWLLRFDGYIYNRGTGALELTGSAPVDSTMSTVQQRIYASDGSYQDHAHQPPPRILFEPADGHNHWHLRAAAAYSLWDESRTQQVAPSQKVGFCLVDSTRIDPWAPVNARYTLEGGAFCAHNRPDSDAVTMGISAGWRDFYHRSLAFQWVDISEVQPGRYALRSDVDPERVIIEAAENNAPAFVDAVVPGHLATPFSTTVVNLLPSTIRLRSMTFGSPGTRQFRIDEAPSHGTLDQRVGVWFDASSVRYTPDFGYRGQDSFRFSARDKTIAFPRTPRSVTATLGVGVAPIAAHRASDGVGAESAFAHPRRAPDVPGALPERNGPTLSEPQVFAHHDDLVVRTVSWRTGVVTVAVVSAGQVLESCSATVPAGMPYTCLFSSAKTLPEGAMVTTALRAGDVALATRSTAVP